MATYTPDKTIYTGVTVGGITTGGFDTIKGGYSLSLGEKDGTYYLTNEYAGVLNRAPLSGIISFIILSDSDYRAAMKNPVLKGLVATKETKEKFFIREKNVLSLISISKVQAETVLNWLAGQD